MAKSAEPQRDEPPKFPGLTNAYFQALELVKDGFLQPFSAGQLGNQTRKIPDKVSSLVEGGVHGGNSVSYQAVIKDMDYERVLSLAIAKIPAENRVRWAAGELEITDNNIVEIDLIISMTQDQSALIVDNGITIRSGRDAAKEGYHASIRVISPAQVDVKPDEYWTKNGGEMLKDISARLVADSLQIAIRDSEMLKSIPDGGLFRTMRYKEGEVERFERAQVVSNGCNRILIRTLRGDLMLVPVSRPIAGGDISCQQARVRQYFAGSLQ